MPTNWEEPSKKKKKPKKASLLEEDSAKTAAAIKGAIKDAKKKRKSKESFAVKDHRESAVNFLNGGMKMEDEDEGMSGMANNAYLDLDGKVSF